MVHPVPPVAYVHLSAVIALWSVRHGNVQNHASTLKGLCIGGPVIARAFTLSPGRLLGNLVWKGCWNC